MLSVPKNNAPSQPLEAVNRKKEITMQHAKLEVINGEAHLSSLQIAKDIEVQHKNVLSAIETRVRRLTIQPATAPFVSRHIIESSYLDAQKKPRKMYLLTEAGYALCTFLFTTDRALEWQVRYVETFEWMRGLLMEKAIGKVRLSMAHQLVLNDGEAEFVRRPLPFGLIIKSLRAMGLLPDMSNDRLKRLVETGVVEGKIIPRESFAYKDSFHNYLSSLGIVPTGIFQEAANA
jgi:Rha family phage regulatory protein